MTNLIMTVEWAPVYVLAVTVERYVLLW